MDKATTQVVGRMTRDPKLFGEGDSKRALFTVAANLGYGDNKNTVFVDCIAWGKRAEIIMDNFSKGTAISVDGNLDPDNRPNSDDKSNKLRVKVLDINAIAPLGAGLKGGSSQGNHSSANEESAEIPF